MDVIQEKVLGKKRGLCLGRYGSWNIDSNNISEGWFYCDNCGKAYSGKRECSEFPFSNFTLRDVMKGLGRHGIYTMIRYDALREKNNFTVVLDNQRIGDTDEPLELLCSYLEDKYRKDLYKN